MTITEFLTTPCHVFSGVSLRRPVAARVLLHRRFCTVRPGYTDHTSQRFPVHKRASGRAASMPTPMITIAPGRRLMSLASPPPGPRSGSYHRPNVPSSPYDADASDTINADASDTINADAPIPSTQTSQHYLHRELQQAPGMHLSPAVASLSACSTVYLYVSTKKQLSRTPIED
jgi:hypothetical protein